MKNTYRIEVKAQCPVNPTDTDLYQFELESQAIIEVERILEFFAKEAGKTEVFQEELTRLCAVTLGVKATSIGWHSGIQVICYAP
jgi:hypothetical protein